MRNSFLKIGMALVVSVTAISSALAATGMVTLHGHIPAVVSQLQSKGLLPANTNMNLAIGLPLRNTQEMSELLQQIYDPASTNYHHYLTPEEFTARFGPSEQDYEAVINFANANGFEVTGLHPNRMLLDVRAKASDIENAFHVTLNIYHDPQKNRDFFAPNADPSVNSSVPILDVSGLNNYAVPRPMLHKVPANSVSPAIGSGPGNSYIGNDFRRAYLPGTSLDGSGQMVGLLQFDGYFPSDIANYENQAGITNVPLQNVLLDGFTGAPGVNDDEVCLDIETVISMASGLSKVVVFEAGPFGIFNDILNAMAASNQIKQFSSSWGYSGVPNATTHQIFLQMAFQGQTFFQASGDGDAWVNPIWQPGDDPYVTVVGGTTLSMNGIGESYSSETVWNWGNLGSDNAWAPNGNGYWGSGGGVSANYTIPSWQTNINMPARGGSATMRNIPDVALTADNVFVVFGGGSQGAFGGTSCAAPLWAGFMALVNQQATNNGHAPIGFLNPAIYAIANGTNYTNCFHDVTTGNNKWSGSPALFDAVTNYDLCTGLGTPNGTNLINALTAIGVTNPVTHLSPPPAPYGTTLAALNGANPNGDWNLFVLDDAPGDSGIISNGWTMTLTIANPVGAPADKFLSMSASASPVSVGGNATYILAVTNYGPSTSSNVIVSDTLPGGLPVISTDATQGTINRSGTLLTWNVGTLNTNAGAQLTITVQPTSSGDYFNSAIVNGNTPDPNPDDDFASATITAAITTPPALGTITATNGSFYFSVTSAANQTNVIQSSTNLINWISIYTNVGPFSFTNAVDPAYPALFFRDVITGP